MRITYHVAEKKKTNTQIPEEEKEERRQEEKRAFVIPPAMLVPCLLHLPRTLIHPPTSDFTGSQDVTQHPNHPPSQMPPGTTTPSSHHVDPPSLSAGPLRAAGSLSSMQCVEAKQKPMRQTHGMLTSKHTPGKIKSGESNKSAVPGPVL